MSDWGATASWDFALKGLDQDSSVQRDVKLWGQESFTALLRKAYPEGKLPKERLSDMVRLILRSMYAIGIDKRGPPAPTVDMANHNETALKTARQGIVLLKNEGALLPLSSHKPLKIAVIMDNH
jgi:beta-glucosidase